MAWLEVARQDIYWHIGHEVILMIPLRILIIIKPVFDYRDLWKTHSKYSSALIKVIKNLTQTQHVE